MTLRVTRVAAQVAGAVTDSDLRVTRVTAKVAGQVTDGALRVTRSYALVAGEVSATDTLRVSGFRVQVGTTDGDDVPRFSSELGTNFSTLGAHSFVLGLPPLAAGGSIKSLTASSTVAFSQAAQEDGSENALLTGVVGDPNAVLGGQEFLPGWDELWEFESQLGKETSNANNISVGLLGVDELAILIGLTSKLSTPESLLGAGFTLGLGALTQTVNVINLTASNTVSFTQTNAREKTKPRTASSTLTFSQTNARAGSFSATASNAIIFTQSNITAGPKPRTASNSITFGHSAAPNILARTASNVITFSQKSDVGGVKELTADNSVLFTQTAAPGLLTRTASNLLEFEQATTPGFAGVNAIVLTASDSITFTQSNARYIIFADAIALSGQSTINFTQRAIFPIPLTASNTIIFTHSADGVPGKSGTHVIEFTQTVIANHWRSLTASNTVNFQHGFSAVQFRDGIPVIGLGGCDATKTYSPYAGGDTPVIRPVAPALDRHSDVIFFTPTGPICTATSSITLRTPNFGDRDRNQYNRVNRESRGGSLTIFRDPKWPKIRTLVMDFSGLKDTEVDGILTFLEDTLGQQIGFRDWNGRVWTGIITTPDAAITRTGTDRNDLALEMEVTDNGLNLNACNTITFTQSNTRVVETP
jgi:hypothetical protein